MKVKLIVALALIVIVSLPSLLMGAETVHFFDCRECHLSGATLNELAGGNVCLRCHTGSGVNTVFNSGSRYNSVGTHTLAPDANFDIGDASHIYGNNPLPSSENSHHWAVSTTYNAASGSREPNRTLHPNMFSRYNVSTGKVTCSRCHDPHGDAATNPKLLRLSADNLSPMTENELCEACHSDFAGGLAAPGNDGLMTHPVLNSTELVAITSGNPAYDITGIQNYNAAAPYTNSAVLVDGGVSCMSCHGPHFTDSNASTPDGPAQASTGDGLLLRSDGPTIAGVTRNETAQLRSNLCQSCHTYQLHGKSISGTYSSGTRQIGCLDCHGGHSYNGGTPSNFVLSDASPDAVPTRVNRADGPVVDVTFPVYTAASSTRDSWADNAGSGSANGFCEQCHGDVNQLGTAVGDIDKDHNSGVEECTTCHIHGDPGHSFAVDASAATCGACHGFPPYKTVSGDEAKIFDPAGENGGYAYNISDGSGATAEWNYLDDSGYYKDEATTAHLTHAGYKTVNQYYFLGSSGVENCQPCHGPGAGSTNHREPGVVESFRDVAWNDVATGKTKTGTAVLSPTYNQTTARCDAVYCHSNGFPRTSVSYNSLTQITPTWDTLSDGGGNGGRDFIFGSANRCSFCHGDDATTMAAGDKYNSPAHIKHLSAPYSYGCNVCHASTAATNSTLQPNATDGQSGGTHVNSVADVVYNTTFMGGVLSGEVYTGADATNGTCSVYCHDPGDLGTTADWDNGALACNACHANTALTTGSHAIHVDPTKADISCDDCHGAGAAAGTHSGHVDGTPDLTAGVCDSCHGVENSGPAWDVTPTWGNATSEDCRTCHTGAVTTSYNSVSLANIAAPDKSTALTVGHNVPTGNPNYNSTGNLAANKTCEDCHLSLTTGHVDGLGNDDRLVGAFSCNDCHTAGGSRSSEATVRVMTHDNTDVGYTLKKRADFGKACFACHDPHGSSNIAMIHDSQTKQNSVDPDSPNKDFSGDVVFADFNSFDPVAGSNLQAICATCHTATAHNNQAGTGTHNEGLDCQSCHDHNQAVGGFMPTGGTACNDCHGNPPLIVADMPHGGNPGAHAVHSIIGSDVPPEDTSDCGVCHLGAESYTLAPGGTHMDGSTDGGLMAGITNDNCTSACHNSVSAGDGSWSDADGLSCSACHGYTFGSTPPMTSGSHGPHVNTATNAKTCADCHGTEEAPGVGPLTHVPAGVGATDILKLQDRATALPSEGDVVRTDMNWSSPTCSSTGAGFALGCHATGAPTWNVPASSDNCIECHTDTTTSTVNPTSGLHNVTPIVSEVRHDGSLTCEACHGDTTALGTHADGSFTGGNGQLVQMGLVAGFYTQTANNEGTCATTTCHLSNSDDWAHVWTNTANYYTSSTLSCGGCHGDNSGFNAGVTHNVGTGTMWSKHGTGTNYQCKDCHALETAAYAFTSGSADWAAAPASEITNHGNGVIEINSTGTGYNYTTGYCVDCHSAAKYNFADTAWSETGGLIAGDAIVTVCGECHTGGKTPGSSSGAHDIHGSNLSDETTCYPCHGNNATNGYGVYTGTHNDGLRTMVSVTYSQAARYNTTGTCSTSNCHNQGVDQSDAWNSNTLACNDCHYYEVSPVSANNTGSFQIGGSHNVHFNSAIITSCDQCHPDNSGDTTAANNTTPRSHIQATGITARAVPSPAVVGASGVNVSGWSDGPNTCSTAACHNPTPGDSKVSVAWGTTNVVCTMCHAVSSPGPVSGSHAAHFAAGFGRTLECLDCHDDNTGLTDHQNGTVNVRVRNTSLVFGTVATPTAANACGTNECHQDGSKAAPDSGSYTWGTPIAGTCTACHGVTGAALDAVDGAHTTHLTGTEGPMIGTACGDCHDAVSSSDMTGKAAHLNNIPTFSDSAAKAATTACNNCHGNSSGGGAALITTAKANWNASANVTCESCHGAGDLATENANGTGVVAPDRGGANYTAVGHGLTTGAAPNRACADCHSTTTAHISGTLADANRLVPQGLGLINFETPGQENAYCNECHLTTMFPHYANSNTPGGASDDGLYCYVCHEPHGLSGYDAMVRDTIQGRAVAAFPDRTVGSSYQKAGFDGVCQVCHDAEVGHYDRAQNDGHNSGTACTDCHAHTDDPAFQASATGCVGCHGGSGKYWPVDTTASADNSLGDTSAANGAGKHPQHMAALADKLYPLDSGDTINNLLTDNTGNYLELLSDAKQKALCEYCHAAVTNDTDHGVVGNLPAEVFLPSGGGRKANNVWGDPDTDATFNSGTGTCSTVDCHFNNAVTPHWYADNTPPAEVLLTAETGSEPKSIRVYWNAPGDDGLVANTTAYVYEMRYGKTIGEALDYTVGAGNYVGGMPATYKQGEPTEVIVENLEPSTTYYFSMRTRDTAGNWSDIPVSTVTAVSNSDSQAPDFGGINKASTADVSSAINLVWTGAEDHSMPITYKIWQKVYDPQNLLDMDVDLPIVTGWTDQKYQATGLADDTIYTFGVRACDANAICETNTQTLSAVAKLPLSVPKLPANYVSVGSTTLVLDGTPGGGAANQTLPLVFAPGANVAATTDYFVDSFNVELYSANGGTVTMQVGTSTNGTDFTAFPEAQFTKSVTLARKARRLVTFKVADANGKRVTKNTERIAVQLSGSATASYGSATTGGILSLSEKLVNVPPSSPSLNAVVTGAKVDMTWTQVTDTVDGVNDDAELHYDIYGSIDNGATWDYLVATDLPVTYVAYSWNTQVSGVPATTQLAVQLRPGDNFDHYTGAGSMVSGLSIDNSADKVAPGAPTELVTEKRPKSGTVWLTWSAPGDDEANHGRAKRYDIVYAPAATLITDANFYDSPATTTEVYGEPAPDFGGTLQSYEVTGLTPGVNYNFAIKAVDESGNVSPISVAKTVGSDQQFGGPRCGMCHTTAPSVVSSVGNHKLHGFTLNQCDKCHDNGTLKPSDFGLDHQDGKLEMGFGPGKAHKGWISGNRIYYTDDGSALGTIIYDDTDGFGGFGDGTYATTGDATDNGTCSNFGALGVGGCHGPAGSDPDGGGPLPTYLPAPNWSAAATLDCSLCHGNPDRVLDFYGRNYDGHVDAAADPQNPLPGEIPDQILGAPTVDNHGNYDPAAATAAERKYIGQHEKHLNYSFRFSKGDSCALCHKGDYAERLNLDSRHGNGEIDVELDLVAAGPDAVWLPGNATTPGSCSSMSPETCHPKAVSPNWDSSEAFDCVGCHSMGGTTPGHTTDPNKAITNDITTGDPDVTTYVPGAEVVSGNCLYCHFGGHPLDDVGGEALILENNPQVGMDYRSGGVHLRASIGGRPAVTTEAELCWSCHGANGISEWAADDGTYNTETAPTKAGTNLNYNYGTVSGGAYASSWVTSTPGQGAMWTSGTLAFGYKTGRIQSTHSTSVSGNSAVLGVDYAYTEAVDAIDIIRCSNCHDVHDLNKATADTSTGAPYLRGSWKRNPYKEDGAPMSGTNYTSMKTAGAYAYGPVPRGGTTYIQMGGYQIDQNNNNPTSGWSLSTSAGLCTLCHNPAGGVDAMDKKTGENLWLGTNGHSNAAIGGSTANAANILTTTIRNPLGRIPTTPWANIVANGEGSGVPVMGYEHQSVNVKYGEGIRGFSGRMGRGWDVFQPVPDQQAFRGFDWGVSQEDSTAVDAGYHAFSCSKCHNPHASRLPKLMITNCLDINHNTWDDTYTTGTGNNAQNSGTLSADNENVSLSSVTSAQNCHRYKDAQFVNSTGDGWNKVTPWIEFP